MSDDTIQEIHKVHVAGNAKYTYFLLAAAGAAIGFAVQKTEGLKVSWWLLPVAMATLCWAVSFYFGCRSADLVQKALASNITMLQIKRGNHLQQPSFSQTVYAAQKLEELTVSYGDKAADANFLQFIFFVAGALCFIAWRIAEMVRIS
ncbi:MAG: hypothetical protein Q7K57_47425 [Burkholderiaceae bacterium]|nr:hypothetical protein [Burkholderiaceae bacterium]